MKIKSFGCSFVFGTDLHDDGRNLPHACPSQHTWPALLARHLGYEYKCYARPGAGNLQIWEKIANEIASRESALYVIGWTWIDRFDYIKENATNWFNGTRWKTIMPIDQDTTAEMYYRDLHSEHLDKMKSLIYVKSAVDLLLQNRCQFIMTSMDELLMDQSCNLSSGMYPMQEFLEPYISSFDTKNFLDYSRDNGHPISATSHPLESAHRDAADLVINNLQHYIKGEKNAC
jgi:hypothetical protein